MYDTPLRGGASQQGALYNPPLAKGAVACARPGPYQNNKTAFASEALPMFLVYAQWLACRPSRATFILGRFS